MTEFSEFIHYGAIALTIAINAIGVGIGQGLTSSAALDAINQQPSARPGIFNAAILGIALIETAAVFGTFISFLLLFGAHKAHSIHVGIAEIGIVLAICLPGFVLGIASAMPARAACFAIARQPFFAQQILRFMLITLSLIQTPIIFGLIVALFIRGQAADVHTMRESLRLLASGLCIGLGSIGPAIGLALFAQQACKSLGMNRKAYNKLLSFTLISEAIIETPIIFALVISSSLLFIVPRLEQENLLDGIVMIAAALCTGIGTIGPGISSGKTATAACHQIALDPEIYGILSRVSMFAQGLIETTAIYAILISFLLLFFR